MKVTLNSSKEVIVHNFTKITLEQFLNGNMNSNAYAWVSGYLIMLSHHEEELRDTQIQNGLWSFRSAQIAPMPEFQETIRGRHNEISIFDQSGDEILEAIIDEVKKCKI